jgi:hypothetical protein
MMKTEQKHGLLLISVMLFLSSRPASSAEPRCVGQWHFELMPDPAKDSWVPEGSLCRSKKLPRVFDISVWPKGDGYVDMSGTPYSPTDLYTLGGVCDFRFEGKDSGLPENNDFAIEVKDSESMVRGEAKCSEASPRRPDGVRTGVSLVAAVTGTRSPGRAHTPAAPSPNHEQVLATVLRACREGEPDALWKVMTARFRAEIEQRAAEMRESLNAADLRKLYGYHGQRRKFSGLDYLRYSLTTGDSYHNPCGNAKQWKVGLSKPIAGGTFVAIERSAVAAFGLKFVKDNQVWQLDQITQPVAIEPE